MQSDMKKILMMFFALMTGVTAASAQLSSGDYFEGLSRKIGFSRMIAPHGLEITYDKTVHVKTHYTEALKMLRIHLSKMLIIVTFVTLMTYLSVHYLR